MKEITNIDKQVANVNKQVLELRKDIHLVMASKFPNVSMQTNDLIELAIDIWRVEQKINQFSLSLPENQGELFRKSFQKLKRYLDKNDIEIVDYKGQKFNDGLNVDILAVEKDPTIAESIVKETKEPTILLKGQVVRRAKVIVLEKDNAVLAEENK